MGWPEDSLLKEHSPSCYDNSSSNTKGIRTLEKSCYSKFPGELTGCVNDVPTAKLYPHQRHKESFAPSATKLAESDTSTLERFLT